MFWVVCLFVGVSSGVSSGVSPCFLLSIAVVVLAVVVVSSISSWITSSSSRMYVVEPVREGHCGIVCSI